MSVALKCIEPVTAIGCAFAAVAVGVLDAGITAGAMVGGAGLLARLREHRTKPGLENWARIEKLQKAILRSMDRWDTDQDTRDAVTLADASMARNLEHVMLSRKELAAASVSLEAWADRVARLVAERLFERDPIFAPASVARTFAIDVMTAALDAAKADPDYMVGLTLDMVIVGNREQVRTQHMIGELGAGQVRTQEMIDELGARIGAPAAPVPFWVDPEGGGALMDRGMPGAGTSAAEIAAKAPLYGGKPVLERSALKFVALGHTFDRETVKELGERIRAAPGRCSSFTLRARHGNGLSLALAQLVRDFSADGRTEILSVIGDRPRTLRLLELVEEKTEPFIAWARSLTPARELLLVVIDDVWGRPIGDGKLVDFRIACKQAFAGGEGPKLAFVFGSFGAARTLDEDGDMMLELTDADRAACYARMAEAEPRIIKGYSGGPPPEARQLGEDAQALIDFHLQHGKPLRSTVAHWLARIDDLDPAQRELLAAVATAELLDLAVPEPVAKSLCEKRGLSSLADADEIVAANDRLTMLDDEGPAIGLSCPWRAKSILQRMDCFTEDFLQATFRELIETALADFEARCPDGAQSLDFARHILQRLGKPEFFPVPNKEEIGRRILEPLLPRLAELSRRFDIAERAKWAGTISVWAEARRHRKPESTEAPRRRSPEPPQDRAFREQCAELVGRLAEKCLFAVRDGEAELSPRLAVSLLRASRRLLASRLHRDLHGEADKSGRLADHLNFRLSKAGMLRLLQLQLEEAEAAERAYRANELITSYCRFHADLHMHRDGDRNFPSQPLCHDITSLLKEASNAFGRNGVAFDAGTWIECARYIWVHPSDRSRQRDACTARRLRLDHAESTVRCNPVTLATWEERVGTARRKMVKPLAGRPALRNCGPG